MALALDGSAHGNSGSASSQAVTLTTALAGIIYVVILTNGGPITGVSDTAGLTYALRASASAGGSNVIETWYAVSAGAHTSNVITATTTSANFITVEAFGVSGCDTSTIWDAHAGIPVTAGGAAPVTPLSISTSTADDFIIGVMREANTASPIEDTGWTKISGADYSLSEYKIVSSVQTALAVQEGVVDANAANGAIADAIIIASAGGGTLPSGGHDMRGSTQSDADASLLRW